jgi:hypothetical protein
MNSTRKNPILWNRLIPYLVEFLIFLAGFAFYLRQVACDLPETSASITPRIGSKPEGLSCGHPHHALFSRPHVLTPNR